MSHLDWDENFAKQMDRAVFQGLMDTAADIVKDAQARVRVDTGKLRANIKLQALPEIKDGMMSLEVGVDSDTVPYALMQEFGPADGRNYSWTPYLRPAYDINGPKLTDNIAKYRGW